MYKQADTPLKLAIELLLLHILFILLTPLLLTLGYLSIIVPLLYFAILFLVGLRKTKNFPKAPRTTLLAGYLSQFPGIIISFIIMTGKAWPFGLDVFEFLIQIWQTPISPIYPLLPHIRFNGIPLYFCLTLTSSFLLPIFPVSGAYLSQKLKRSSENTV